MSNWNERRVANIIIDHYHNYNVKNQKDQWMYFRGLRTFIGTTSGVAANETHLRGDLYSLIDDYYSERYIDLYVMSRYKPYKRIAYEIKVSYSDFKKELSNPVKSCAGKRLANEFIFAAPEGVLPADEIPEDCGFLEVTEDEKMNMIIRPVTWEVDEFPIEFIASLLSNKWKAGKD